MDCIVNQMIPAYVRSISFKIHFGSIFPLVFLKCPVQILAEPPTLLWVLVVFRYRSRPMSQFWKDRFLPRHFQDLKELSYKYPTQHNLSYNYKKMNTFIREICFYFLRSFPNILLLPHAESRGLPTGVNPLTAQADTTFILEASITIFNQHFTSNYEPQIRHNLNYNTLMWVCLTVKIWW
jgi:hypothetical protein